MDKDSYLIVGTAGHVDHGKTTLIRALTGRETDRLPEEKKRGISIELGFAPFTLPSGQRAGVVDVPGHEKFVRHMVAGAYGMDVVLLVVAADEGVMPQTVEHLDILTLLGVQRGVVVLTKVDLVDGTWRELIEQETRKSLEGTFLEGAPFFPFAAPTGEGLRELLTAIDLLLADVAPRPSDGPVRLPIDRSFVMSGFGTVVTGTLHSGTVKAEDRVVVVPSERSVRVRKVQIHGEERPEGRAGQRVAVNLAGVDSQEVQRGGLLMTPGGSGGERTQTFYARLDLLKKAPTLKSGQRIHFHSLTFETVGRVTTLEETSIAPGSSGYVRIRTEDPLWLLPGDRFVARRFSPVETLGGGILLATSGRFRHGSVEDLQDLRRLEAEGAVGQLSVEARRYLVVTPKVTLPGVQEALLGLIRGGDILEKSGAYVGRGALALRAQRLTSHLEELHATSPERFGEGREVIRQIFFPEADPRLYGALLEELEGEGKIALRGDLVGLPSALTPGQGRVDPKAGVLLQILDENLFSPPEGEETEARSGLSRDDVERYSRYLVQEGQAIRAGGILFSRSAVDEAKTRLDLFFSTHRELPTSEFRNLLGTSRKFAIPLLEYLDTQKYTRRVGDVRIRSGSGKGSGSPPD